MSLYPGHRFPKDDYFFRTEQNYYTWVIGTENSVDNGIQRFLRYLDRQEKIILDEPEIYSWMDDGHICYKILAHALSKLEYFEEKYKQLDKFNVKK